MPTSELKCQHAGEKYLTQWYCQGYCGKIMHGCKADEHECPGPIDVGFFWLFIRRSILGRSELCDSGRQLWVHHYCAEGQELEVFVSNEQALKMKALHEQIVADIKSARQTYKMSVEEIVYEVLNYELPYDQIMETDYA